MKKRLLIFLIFSFSLFSTYAQNQDSLHYGLNINAQPANRQLCVNVGLGYSPGFETTIASTHPFVPSYPMSFSSATANFGIVADYAFVKKCSIGLASSYQSEHVIGYGGIVADKLTKINMATRLLYHFASNKDYLDQYIGLRVGVSYWNDSPINENPPYNPEYVMNKPYLFAPSFQFLYGLRYYVVDYLGLQFEAGIGSPYFIETGLAFRFGKKTTKN